MSIIKHVTLQKIVAHDFRYDLRILDLLLCFDPKQLFHNNSIINITDVYYQGSLDISWQNQSPSLL